MTRVDEVLVPRRIRATDAVDGGASSDGGAPPRGSSSKYTTSLYRQHVVAQAANAEAAGGSAAAEPVDPLLERLRARDEVVPTDAAASSVADYIREIDRRTRFLAPVEAAAPSYTYTAIDEYGSFETHQRLEGRDASRLIPYDPLDPSSSRAPSWAGGRFAPEPEPEPEARQPSRISARESKVFALPAPGAGTSRERGAPPPPPPSYEPDEQGTDPGGGCSVM